MDKAWGFMSKEKKFMFHILRSAKSTTISPHLNQTCNFFPDTNVVYLNMFCLHQQVKSNINWSLITISYSNHLSGRNTVELVPSEMLTYPNGVGKKNYE